MRWRRGGVNKKRWKKWKIQCRDFRRFEEPSDSGRDKRNMMMKDRRRIMCSNRRRMSIIRRRIQLNHHNNKNEKNSNSSNINDNISETKKIKIKKSINKRSTKKNSNKKKNTINMIQWCQNKKRRKKSKEVKKRIKHGDGINHKKLL